MPLLFAIVMVVITEKARRGVVNESLYADGRFWNWKDALISKGLKINIRNKSDGT